MREAMLAGIARVVPDVLTFATPIFVDAAGAYLSQREHDDIVDGFDYVSIGEDVSPVSSLLWNAVGNSCIHGFEVNSGEFIFGSSRRLAAFLKENEGLWAAKRGTADLVQRLIERSRSDVLSRTSDTQPLVRAFVRERAADLTRHSFVERSGTYNSRTIQHSKPRERPITRHADVLMCRTENEFRLACAEFSRHLGFDSIWMITMVDEIGKSPDYSPRWTNDRDPVINYMTRSSLPIVWDQEFYASRGILDIWKEHAALGMRTGIGFALHFPDGRHFFIGVDRAEALPTKTLKLTRVVADLQLFAVQAHHAAERIFFPQCEQPERPMLTRRELECLSWTMEGKTTWEIGAILGISERTTVLNIHNAMRKLACHNKHQAVLKALRLGLIR